MLSELRRLIATETSNLVIELKPQPGGDLLICPRFLFEAERGEWHNTLYVLSWILKVVRLANPVWSPPEISVRSTAAATRAEAIETLGASPRFGHDRTGFRIPASMLALPLRKRPAAGRDRCVQEDALWSTAPAETYADAVGQMIRSYARDRWLSVEQASEVANTSVRTLQRRLSAEHATYSNIVDRTRAQIAGDLLKETDAPIAEIADMLGYEHQGDFTRAFRRWAGVSPSEFRRRRQLD